MEKDEPVLLIAAGMLQEKKPFLKNKVDNIYLNYGLLGLGTTLYNKGYKSVKMFQGDRKSSAEILLEIEESGIVLKDLKYPVFISVPSFFSVPWAMDFMEELKLRSGNIKIILGGRWVLDKNLEWCKKKFKHVDYYCTGCPDNIIEKLLFSCKWSELSGSLSSNTPFGKFEFDILNNFKEYQPVIEVSRGCGRGCGFCLEKEYPVSGVKNAKNVVEEAMDICKTYGTDELNFYFQASIFNPSIQWAEEFRTYYKNNDMKFKWRFETRVDTINHEALAILADAGLKVIDLGLESASHIQLLRMGKCKNPNNYLENASNLLSFMKRKGIWSKLNILLYMGENEETIAETMEWLDRQHDNIVGLSVNPIIIYLNGKETDAFINHVTQETEMAVDVDFLEEHGYTNIDLSKEINIEKAQDITNMLLEKYMTMENYQTLKSICYTKRELGC